MGRWLVEQSFQGSLKFRRRQMNYLFAFCFCSLLRLGSAGAKTMQVQGALGSNVLLESGNSADLHGREVVWEFTSSNGTEFTILDVGPNHPEVKPNKHFKDLIFNLSTGDLLLSNLKTSDQGNYTVSIDGQERRKIELRIFEMKQVEGALGSNVSLESGSSANLHGREVVWKFTSNNGTEFTILDVGPNHPEVKPNKYFEDRLIFNLSTGDLLLSNLKTSDQGNYTISVNGRKLRKIDLRIFEMKRVQGVLGENVLLESGNSADLHGHEVVWKFTSNNGTEFTILDVGPNHPEEKPNKYFKDRLNFNLSTGDLLLSNLKTSDQGNYTISVNGLKLRKIDLRIFGPSADDIPMIVLSISALVFSSVYLIAVFPLNIWKCKSNRELPKYKWWKYVLYLCNILQLPVILAAFSCSIHFKEQRYTFHTWNVLIASVVECTVSFIVASMFHYSLHSRICLWVRKGYSWMTGRNKSNTNEKGPQNAEELQSFTTFPTEDAGYVHSD
ncbi:uncharacterized protein LOC134346677 isoform X2 [Mobula hypostoma]|uniref:uncharacterized protein LOC134346677 isoform X2 n=1 Tax=Mobula hypostoma TaxID=723540 RepID=UPI002FC30D62